MLEEIPDLIIGGVCFGAFLVLAVLFGGMLQRVNKSRHIRALSGLAPVVQGAVDGDDHSAWLDGEYGGRKVFVRMTPEKNISQSSEYTIRIHAFEIAFLDVPGVSAWELAFRGTLRKRWEIKTPDTALKDRLDQAGLVVRMKDMGDRAVVRYDAARRELWYTEELATRRTPDVRRFKTQLALLAGVEDINRAVNSPAEQRQNPA